MSRKILPTVFFVLLTVSVARADGLRDNDPKSVRPVPRPGVRPAGSGFVQLPDKLKDLRARITRAASSKDPAIRALISDVEIYYRAVSDALTYNEVDAILADLPHRSARLSGSSQDAPPLSRR